MSFLSDALGKIEAAAVDAGAASLGSSLDRAGKSAIDPFTGAIKKLVAPVSAQEVLNTAPIPDEIPKTPALAQQTPPPPPTRPSQVQAAEINKENTAFYMKPTFLIGAALIVAAGAFFFFRKK